jgi:hypothetical protein
MKYESFTGVALKMLHDAVRRAIVMDQIHINVGKPPPCETSSIEEWRIHAKALEDQMTKLGVSFERARFLDEMS